VLGCVPGKEEFDPGDFNVGRKSSESSIYSTVWEQDCYAGSAPLGMVSMGERGLISSSTYVLAGKLGQFEHSEKPIRKREPKAHPHGALRKWIEWNKIDERESGAQES